MFSQVLIDIHKELQNYKEHRPTFTSYVETRLSNSLQQYSKDLDSSVESLVAKQHINVLYRYTEAKK